MCTIAEGIVRAIIQPDPWTSNKLKKNASNSNKKQKFHSKERA
jgi:hypothetical protein